jgi:hypothetical protein
MVNFVHAIQYPQFAHLVPHRDDSGVCCAVLFTGRHIEPASEKSDSHGHFHVRRLYRIAIRIACLINGNLHFAGAHAVPQPLIAGAPGYNDRTKIIYLAKVNTKPVRIRAAPCLPYGSSGIGQQI